MLLNDEEVACESTGEHPIIHTLLSHMMPWLVRSLIIFSEKRRLHSEQMLDLSLKISAYLTIKC